MSLEMMRPFALLILAALLACRSDNGAQVAESVVQTVVCDSLFVRDTTRLVVIGDSTVRGGTHFVEEDYASALRFLGPLPEGLQADFEAKRGAVRRVDSLHTKVPMQRFTAADRARLRAQRNPTLYWTAFYQQFPGSSGLVEVSRVGFSRDGASALMLIEHGCGGLCGGTTYVLLAKGSGRWRVVRTAEPRVV